MKNGDEMKIKDINSNYVARKEEIKIEPLIENDINNDIVNICLLYTSPSPRDP